MEKRKTMVDEKEVEPKAPEKGTKEEVALELMKFIAVSTSYGKTSGSAGFGGKTGTRTPEEQAEAMLELFMRCRKAVALPLP